MLTKIYQQVSKMDTIPSIRNFLLIQNHNFIYITLVLVLSIIVTPYSSVTEQPEQQSLSKVDQIVSLLLTT